MQKNNEEIKQIQAIEIKIFAVARHYFLLTAG